MAPMALALPAAANPATPPPMISTCTPAHQGGETHVNLSFHEAERQAGKLTFAGGTFPAAVICPVKKRPKLLAASTTDLYLRRGGQDRAQGVRGWSSPRAQSSNTHPAMLAMELSASKP